MVNAAKHPDEVPRPVLAVIAPRDAPLQRAMPNGPEFFISGEEVLTYFKERCSRFTPEA